MEGVTEKSRIWYIVNVEGVVYRPDDNRYLMIVRGAGEKHLPGVLSFPGGKVEGAYFVQDVLEITVRAEIKEEVCVELDDIAYVESHAFIGNGEPCIDIVFLCRYKEGEARPGDTQEVDSVSWMSYEEILTHENVPAWTKESLKLAEKKRLQIK